ncbi:ribonuclease E inhibitor RraB [Lysobacter auxotrophicus]|uniref:Ribonuclease E inhibitor RraB n=1 Tax=Lysobacter auxotrophicus TaxID=2992573 RepID=A0ABN6UNY3_9GAMM|nr:ribonuclease E inhibitor RraB [Lysobacter auxotrophicus]BDU16588.1 ribonuclease E inhibitor RraB [Lysobacter auxotrophicus]
MAVIDTLMETAVADTDLLRRLDAQGDRFHIARDVEFLLRAPSAEKATKVASFINDYQYGIATAQGLDDAPSVLLIVHMRIEQHGLRSVSGFMACVCALFGLDYDGWGCVVQTRK